MELDDDRVHLRMHSGVAKPTPRTTESRASAPSAAMPVIVAELLLALQVGQQKIYS